MRKINLLIILLSLLSNFVFAEVISVSANVSCRTDKTAPDTNKHDSSKLSIRSDSSAAKSWIKFNQLGTYDLSLVRKAFLRLTLHEAEPGTNTFNVSTVNDDYTTNIDWAERAITWNNAPGNDTASNSAVLSSAATLMGTVQIVEGAIGSQYFVDVMPAIMADTDGIIQFILHNGSTLINCSTWDHAATTTPPLAAAEYWPTLFLTFPPAGADWPKPEDKATVTTALAELSWTNPEPNDVSSNIICTVYLGNEPNRPAMDQITLSANATTVAINESNFPSFNPLQDLGTYYWVVDCYDTSANKTIPGEWWSFTTYNNKAPVVDAGEDQVTWLPNTVTLTGTASDDGRPANPGTLTFQWEESAGPGTSVIASPNQLSTTVSFTASGDYQFTLTANDGELKTTDTIRVVIGNGPCDASHVFTGDPYNKADQNQDCLVDLNDFMVLIVADWLNCTDTLSLCGG
ncbi:MAG: hypothetical protein ABFD91_12105 [Anaerohalosphaeraceae bacterium]